MRQKIKKDRLELFNFKRNEIEVNIVKDNSEYDIITKLGFEEKIIKGKCLDEVIGEAIAFLDNSAIIDSVFVGNEIIEADNIESLYVEKSKLKIKIKDGEEFYYNINDVDIDYRTISDDLSETYAELISQMRNISIKTKEESYGY